MLERELIGAEMELRRRTSSRTLIEEDLERLVEEDLGRLVEEDLEGLIDDDLERLVVEDPVWNTTVPPCLLICAGRAEAFPRLTKCLQY